MRRCLTVVAIVMAALRGPVPEALGAEGLYLTWNDCASGSLAAANLGFNCLDDSGESHLYCAFIAAQPVDSVLGMEMVVDLQHSSPELPDWWRFDVGGCRDGSLRADGNFTGLTSCADPWRGPPSGGVSSYTVGMPYGGANQARIRLALSVPSTELQNLSPGVMYYAARVVLDHASTVGGPACSGCADGVCLVLNSIVLLRPPRPAGAPSGDVVLQLPGPTGANWATWQSGSLGGCQAVPVRKRTWGEVKSLYR